MKTLHRMLVGFVCPLALMAAGEIVLPSKVLDRQTVITAVYRMPTAITGPGTLVLHWTDTLGRIVEERTIPFALADENEISFPLDLRRAVAMKNVVRVHASVHGKDMKGKDEDRDEDAEVTFIARPPGREWRDYAIIMWQQYPAKLIQALEPLGINGGQFTERSGLLPQFFIDSNMRWYSEGIGTDFYSAYHRWRADRSYGYDLQQAKELLTRDPASLEPFKRHPSFWDSEWRARIHDRLVSVAKDNAPYRPFFYSLADETGIAELAAFWDFDFSDESLVPLRRWLRQRYSTLGALNQEWGSNFPSWDLVTPPTTHTAMQHTDDNFAAWADFKEWMDISYAEALKMGTDAIHEVDPDAYVGVGGGQKPGWGGYDYARITKALTAIEPYDIGKSVEVIRSLNPGMPMLSTGFANGNWEQHRVWYELLHGNRGLIIWDQDHQYVQPDGTPGTRGAQASAYYNEIRDGIGALIINSKPVVDPIAIHYSQASMRTEWMLARRPEADKWMTRSPKLERTDDDFLRVRESWCDLIEDEGLQYNFVAYDQVEKGELLKRGYRVLVLPRSSSLSPAEVTQIREFVAQGGTAIADGEPGTFNEHSRKLSEGSLADLFGGAQDGPVTVHAFGKGRAVLVKTNTINYFQDRLVRKEGPVHALARDLFRSSGVQPEFAITDSSGHAPVGVELHVFRNGGANVITLLSNPLLRVDELGPPDFRSNERFEKPVSVSVALPQPMYLYDVRLRKALGQRHALTVTLTPYEPIVLTAVPSALPGLDVSAPESVERGAAVIVSVGCAHTSAAFHVFHVDVMNPAGKRIAYYSDNLIADGGQAMKLIPLAANDDPGTWMIRVHDLLSGATKNLSLVVK